MFSFRSEPTVIGHWPQIEEEAVRLSYGTSGSLTSENESSAGSGIFSYNVGMGAPLTRRTLSAQQLEPPRETSNGETLNDAIRTGSDSFTKKSDRVRRRWTSSLTNVLLFLRGRSKRSQEEKKESLGRSHRKTKWKEKFTEPWKMWEKKTKSRQEFEKLDCTRSPKSKMKLCGVTTVRKRKEQVLQKRELPHE